MDRTELGALPAVIGHYYTGHVADEAALLLLLLLLQLEINSHCKQSNASSQHALRPQVQRCVSANCGWAQTSEGMKIFIHHHW